jgi:hypothetical protein
MPEENEARPVITVNLPAAGLWSDEPVGGNVNLEEREQQAEKDIREGVELAYPGHDVVVERHEGPLEVHVEGEAEDWKVMAVIETIIDEIGAPTEPEG